MKKMKWQGFNFGKLKNYYVLKNAFKSVLRNKIQMIGLILLIVLTAVIFTLMYTTTQRINNSYENFITASNLHHFVVDLRNKNRIPGKEADETDVNVQKALVEKTAYVQWAMEKVRVANEKNNNFVFAYREGRMVSRVIDNNVSLFKVIALEIQDTIDKLVITEGRNIESEQEVVLSPEFANENKYRVGDIICLQSEQCDVNNLDNNALEIVGLGTSVDYMFPQLDLTTPIPNQAREGMAFVHPHQLGLFSPNKNRQLIEKGIKWQYNKSVEKISLSSEVDREGYFVAQWGAGSEQNISLIQKQLQDYFLSNDSNNDFVFAVNDANYPEYDFSGRVNTLKTILVAYQIMAIALLLMVLIIAGFVIALVTKKRVQNSRTQIGVLKSLGYSSFSIAQGFLVYPLIAAIVGGIIGYLVGICLQIPIISVFNWYFTLPLGKFSFNWLSLLFSTGGTFLLLGLITIVASIWYIKGSPLKLLHPEENMGATILTRWFNYLNRGKRFTTRFRWAVFSKSIAKMLTVMITMVSATLLLTFSITGPKALQDMRTATYKGINYESITEYETPIWNSILSSYGVYNPEIKNNQQGIDGDLYSPKLMVEEKIKPNVKRYRPEFVELLKLVTLNYRLFDLNFYLNSILTKLEPTAEFTPFKNITCMLAVDDWNNKTEADKARHTITDCIISATTKRAPYFVRSKLSSLELTLRKIEVSLAIDILQSGDLMNPTAEFTNGNPLTLQENNGFIDEMNVAATNDADYKNRYDVVLKIYEEIKKRLNNGQTNKPNKDDEQWNRYLNKVVIKLKAIANEWGLTKTFNIQFGLTPYNPDEDELATYFKPNIETISRGNITYENKKKLKLKAYGIERSSKMNLLLDKDNNNLLEAMYENHSLNAEIIPVVINQTIAKHLQINQGDILDINPNKQSLYSKAATADSKIVDLKNWNLKELENGLQEVRNNDIEKETVLYFSFDTDPSAMYKKIISGDVYIKTEDNQNQKMRVIGIQEGYGDPKMFLPKYYADVMLGYIKKGKSWELSEHYEKIKDIFQEVTHFGNDTTPEFKQRFPNMTYDEAVQAMFPLFNAKFSLNKNITDITDSISVAQMYGDFTQLTLKGIITKDKISGDLVQKYIGLGQGAIAFAMPIATHQSVFDEIKGIADSILWAFMVISLLISFVTILITSNIIITENSRLIATMKVIGYSDYKINWLTLGMYLPIVFIAFVIGFPVAWVIMNQLVNYLALNSTWVMPFYFSWGLIFAVLVIILAIYAITFVVGWFILKCVNPIEALKTKD